MTIYKAKKGYDEDVRWTPAMVREDAEARFWLGFGYSTGYDAPFELKLVGTNDTVWEGAFADAGISEADVEAERAIGMLDELL